MVSAVVRYVGPKRAYMGAIGYDAPGGVTVAGRVVLGTSAPVVWHLTCNGLASGDWPSWDLALDSLLSIIDCDLRIVEQLRQMPETPVGAELVWTDNVWHLFPV